MFNGFSPETIDFLWGIRFNNNREWFRAHKDEYEKYLYRPMQDLAAEVNDRFQIDGAILKTARIYRDVRYSHGIPYKEHLWFCIRQPDVFWSEHPSFYFQIEPEGGSCGFISYAPKAAVMQEHRRMIREGSDSLRKGLEGILSNPGFADHSVHYKRPKDGFLPEFSDVYNLKNCFVENAIPVGEQLFSRELPDYLAEQYRTLQPLYEYFRAIEVRLDAEENG